MTRNLDKNRDQMTFVCLDEMVPQDHILLLIDRAIDWNFTGSGSPFFYLREKLYAPL